MSVIEKVLSGSVVKTFVPLNDFEQEVVSRLVALQFARRCSLELEEIYRELQQEILSNSARFVRVRLFSKGGSLNQPDVFFEGYQESNNDLVYIVCNNGMKLYFNDKAELVARSN